MSLFLKPFAPAAALAAMTLAAGASAAEHEARVTHVVREVKLLPEEAAARAATLNDKVSGGTAVKTGDASRSELTFADLTITRLGANSIFCFNKAGRSAEIETGSLLLRVPKNSGGATIATSAVTAATTGTTVIMETARSGRSRLLVLEGAARLWLNKRRSQVKNVRAGQALDVPAGAPTLPDPVDIDLNETTQKHPLLTGFGPLPSQDLIAAAARNQANREPVYQPQPVAAQSSPAAGGFRLPPASLFPNPVRTTRGRPPQPDRTKTDQRGQRGLTSARRAPTPSPKKSPNDPGVR